MASVNWEKCYTYDKKTKQETKQGYRTLRHNCLDTRKIDNHPKNPDINKLYAGSNFAIGPQTFEETWNAWRDRIRELDRTTNKNNRLDRCELLFLEVPVPKDLKPEQVKDWFEDVHEIYCKQFGAKNVIGFQVHGDEVHEYTHADTGKKTMSRVHGHAQIVPEADGQLSAKQVYRYETMNELNNTIHEMSVEKYGVKFMDGSKKKDKRSIATLKQQSLEKQNELLEKEISLKMKKNKELSEENEELHKENDQLDHDISLKRKQKALRDVQNDEREKLLEEKEKRLQRLQDSLQLRETNLQNEIRLGVEKRMRMYREDIQRGSFDDYADNEMTKMK